jgi:hypothetical protein
LRQQEWLRELLLAEGITLQRETQLSEDGGWRRVW